MDSIADIKRLQEMLKQFIQPISERIQNIGKSIADKLEHLRAEIICTGIKVKKAVKIKGEADEKIKSEKQFIKDLAPATDEKIQMLRNKISELEQSRDNISGIFSDKKRNEFDAQIKSLTAQLKLLSENQEFASQALNEIESLEIVSNESGKQIERLKHYRDLLQDIYDDVKSDIDVRLIDEVNAERMSLRSFIEKEVCSSNEINHEDYLLEIKSGSEELKVSTFKI